MMEQTSPKPGQAPPKPLNINRHRIAALAAIPVLIAADQATKIWIKGLIADHGGAITLTPFFNLVHVWNPGISFGLFPAESDRGVYVLLALAGIISALFMAMLVTAKSRLLAYGCAITIGGAVGNMIDRVQYGAVYDFLDFHAFGYHWPAFNIADASIFIGIVMVAIYELFLRSSDTPKTDPAETT